MHIFKDILDFINTLTFIDYVFFFAVILLLILVITLIYFIKSNNDVFSNKSKPDNDLVEITKKLEEEKPRIELTSYEQDQEDKAIISYDELVQKGKLGQINYEDEQDLDGLSVKKINIDGIESDSSVTNLPPTIRVISYQNEEQFLRALKQLQSLLN